MAPRVLSATGPLLARVGTGCPVSDGPTATVVFFLGAMTMKKLELTAKADSHNCAPLPGAPKMSVGNDTYGITGIPSTVAGRGDREKSGTSRQHKGIYPGSGRKDA